MSLQKCRACQRTHTSNGRPLRIIGPESRYPGVCAGCYTTAWRKYQQYQPYPCQVCGQTHTRNGRLKQIYHSGPWAGWCHACRVREQRRRASEKDKNKALSP